MLDIGVCGLLVTLALIISFAWLGSRLDRGIVAALALMLPDPG